MNCCMTIRKSVISLHFSVPLPARVLSIRQCAGATTCIAQCGILNTTSNKTLRVGLTALGGYLEMMPSRVLVAEDSEPYREFICSTLKERSELQIVAEVSDGLRAVRKANELQPDLIVLDIGLPSLNGIEAARRIGELSPESKILFVSQESSIDVVQEALWAGARGYIVKTDAGSELLDAVSAVLRGEQFVGGRFAGHDFASASGASASRGFRATASGPAA